MTKKIAAMVLILLLGVSSAACTSQSPQELPQQPETQGQNEQGQKDQDQKDQGEQGAQEAIKALVASFGENIQQVPLLADEEGVKDAIKTHYTPYLTQDLLTAWIETPEIALGRTVSSPWPDRIEIDSISALSAGVYQVEGRLIEVTSEEKGTDQGAATRPIQLKVVEVEGTFKIDQVEVGDYQ